MRPVSGGRTRRPNNRPHSTKEIPHVHVAGADLPTAQERAWGEGGFRDAQLVESIYGWTVRSGSGLDNWRFIAGRGRNWTFEQALEAAKTWQAEDLTHRFVWAYKSDVPAGAAV